MCWEEVWERASPSASPRSVSTGTTAHHAHRSLPICSLGGHQGLGGKQTAFHFSFQLHQTLQVNNCSSSQSVRHTCEVPWLTQGAAVPTARQICILCSVGCLQASMCWGSDLHLLLTSQESEGVAVAGDVTRPPNSPFLEILGCGFRGRVFT